MGICVDAKKRNADTKTTSQPSDRFHGKVWYDLSVDRMKFWDDNLNSWVEENEITLDLVDATI